MAAARIEADSKREAARSEAEMELAVDGLISAATGPATRLGRFGEELARSIDRVTNGRLGEADDSRQELVPVTAGNAVAASPDAEGSGPGS